MECLTKTIVLVTLVSFFWGIPVQAEDWSMDHCTKTPPAGIDPMLYKWPKTDIDAYSGDPDTNFDKPLYYCHGVHPENKKVFYAWATWKLGRYQEFLYPINFVDTVAGVLSVRGYGFRLSAGPLFLNGKPIIDNLSYHSIDQAHPEPEGKPQIVIVSLILDDSPAVPGEISERHQIIDLGVSPPFIVTEDLPIGWYNNTITGSRDLETALPESYIKITKVAEGVYDFSGESGRAIKEKRPAYQTWRYNRKERSLKKVRCIFGFCF